MEVLKTATERLNTVGKRQFKLGSVPGSGFLYHRQEREERQFVKGYVKVHERLFREAQKDYIPGKMNNFTHALLAAQEVAKEEIKSDVAYLTEENIVQVLIDIFMAGTDTTAVTLQWLCLRLAKEPSIQERIRKEIEDNIGNSPPTLKDKDKLPYTYACILEIFRIYPSSPWSIPHQTACDTEAGGQTIPKCTRVLYNIHSVNHDPALWKDPDAFRPERFLDPVTGQICKRHLQSLMTFGVGLRACPGEKLANAEVFLVFVRLMQRVSVSSPMDGSGVDTTTVRYNVLTYPAMQNIIYTRRYTE